MATRKAKAGKTANVMKVAADEKDFAICGFNADYFVDWACGLLGGYR